MVSFKSLLEQWPNLGVLARDLGLSIHTVAAWKRRNFIPLAYWPRIIMSARKHRIKGVTNRALLAASKGTEAEPAETEADDGRVGP